jgi:8-oxo-dGTP pyrophosphatase MutT (NUDIX family)
MIFHKDRELDNPVYYPGLKTVRYVVQHSVRGSRNSTFKNCTGTRDGTRGGETEIFRDLRARLIPYYVCKKTKELFFILGKEVWNNREGHFGSIGGKCMTTETPFECAQREGCEELLTTFFLEKEKSIWKLVYVYEERVKYNRIRENHVFFVGISEEDKDTIVSQFCAKKDKLKVLYNQNTPVGTSVDTDLEGLFLGKKVTKKLLHDYLEIAELGCFSFKDILEKNNINSYTKKILENFKIN